MKILVNGISSKSGGGFTILKDILHSIESDLSQNEFYVVLPERLASSGVLTHRYKVVSTKCHNVVPFNCLEIRTVCKQFGIDVVFNLSDLPTLCPCPELYFFDWAYACYPVSVVWRRMKWRDFIHRSIKLKLLQYTIRRPAQIVVQIPSMAERLENLYRVKNCVTLPSPVVIHDNTCERPAEPTIVEKLEGWKTLFYPASFTPHKNHDVLLELAKELQEHNLKFQVLLTVDHTKDVRVMEFYRKVKERGLDDYFRNLGVLSHESIMSVYPQVEALLMPTLLESYGLPLVEAMALRTTVIVSDFPFTRDVCGEAAFYFDPLSASSIRKSIEFAFHNELIRNEKKSIGLVNVAMIPSSKETFVEIVNCLKAIRD